MQHWLSAVNGSIYEGDCVPGDRAATDAEVANWQAANSPVPACQLWQLQAVMTPTQWTAVQAAVTALGNAAISAFFAHGTNVIPANSTTLLSLGAAIGLSADQVTALVTQASVISIP